MNAFKLRRFHALAILQCVRWYSKYAISYRQLEEMMAERGVVVDHICVWVNGEWKWLFRAVDKHGRTVDFLLTHRRNTKAARRFLAKALRTHQNWPPHVINTDKNPAYGEAIAKKKEGLLPKEPNHRQVKYLNNRLECGHVS